MILFIISAQVNLFCTRVRGKGGPSENFPMGSLTRVENEQTCDLVVVTIVRGRIVTSVSYGKEYLWFWFIKYMLSNEICTREFCYSVYKHIMIWTIYDMPAYSKHEIYLSTAREINFIVCIKSNRLFFYFRFEWAAFPQEVSSH